MPVIIWTERYRNLCKMMDLHSFLIRHVPVTLEKSDLGKMRLVVDCVVMFPHAAVNLVPLTHRLFRKYAQVRKNCRDERNVIKWTDVAARTDLISVRFEPDQPLHKTPGVGKERPSVSDQSQTTTKSETCGERSDRRDGLELRVATSRSRAARYPSTVWLIMHKFGSTTPWWAC